MALIKSITIGGVDVDCADEFKDKTGCLRVRMREGMPVDVLSGDEVVATLRIRVTTKETLWMTTAIPCTVTAGMTLRTKEPA